MHIQVSPDRTQAEADYERTVREDIEKFRTQAERYMRGEINDDEFRPFRLRRGVYGQRQAGVQMIRTKVPGGVLTSRQMHALADIADEYSGGRSHLTTRQNVQFHFVPLAEVTDLLHALAEVRLTTREACYNSVRNVTASPVAGLTNDEAFDVTPYVRQVALAFLHRELTDNLPRKFKIAFSGGGSRDDVATGMHDIGLTAVVRSENGAEKRGFRVVIGGGLGPLPRESQLLDEFLPVENLVSRIEAVIRLFNRHGNRANKNTARLKFVLRDRGFDWVKETIEREYREILTNGGIPAPEIIPDGFGGFRVEAPPLGQGELLPVLGPLRVDPDYDRWLETNVSEQKHAGYGIVNVRVDQGNLKSSQMHALAQISETAGDGLLRISIDQNILLAWIPLFNLHRVYAALKTVGLHHAGVHEIEDVTTCPGAYSCSLALTKSMNLGHALSDAVASYDDRQVRGLSIKVSGCPNSCGQHWIADIGFYGNSRKVEGRDVPYYQMLLGGGYDQQGHLRFGYAVQSVPAKLAPMAVRRVIEHFLADRKRDETFRQYVERNQVQFFRDLTKDIAKPMEIDPDWYKDWGDEMDFSKSLGKGECAA
jgi:sulfite reductase beta subunit-like hemoprotein